MNIERMHWLIHPGYITDEDLFEYENSDWIDEHLQVYIQHARTLSRSEIMVVLSHKNKNKMHQDLLDHKPHAECIRNLRAILGGRLIYLSNRWKVHENTPDLTAKTLDKMRKVSQKRSYEFSADTPTVAYGEYIDACVPQFASALNKAGQFSKPTLIQTRISELSDATPEEIACAVQFQRTNYPKRHNIVYDIESNQA